MHSISPGTYIASRMFDSVKFIRVTLVVATSMTYCQILNMTIAAFALGLYMLKRGLLWSNVFAANPTRHNAMHLSRNRFINFVPRKGQFAHR
jgi:uncharacterized membrane protein